MGKLLFLLLNLGKMFKLLISEVFIKTKRNIFINTLSQRKLLGKDNVGGNEALRVNLLSDTRPGTGWERF